MKLVALNKIPKKVDNITIDHTNIRQIVDIFKGMEDICDAHEGIGLSAPQVGISKKLCIIRRGYNYSWYVNSSYTGQGELISSTECCLSLPGRSFVVQRFSSIDFMAQMLHKDDNKCNIKSNVLPFRCVFEEGVTGKLAIVIQHEVTHSREEMIDRIGIEIGK